MVKYESMHIGQTIKRIAPDGHETILEIKTYEHLEYLRDLEKKGYICKVIPNVHTSDNVCVACEG